MKPKTLFIIIGVLAVLFIVIVVLGDSGWMDSAGEFSFDNLKSQVGGLLGGSWLAAKDIRSADPLTCMDQLDQGLFNLKAGESCRMIVHSSNATVRRLGLSYQSGLPASIEFAPYDDNQLNTSYTLSPQKTFGVVSIFKKGGILNIQCAKGSAGQTCRLQVIQESCAP